MHEEKHEDREGRWLKSWCARIYKVMQKFDEK